MASEIVKKYDPDDASDDYRANKKSATWTVKAGLAQMLKGEYRDCLTCPHVMELCCHSWFFLPAS